MKINITSSCIDSQQRHLSAGSTHELPLEDVAAIVVAGRGSTVSDEDAKAVRNHLKTASENAARVGARTLTPRW